MAHGRGAQVLGGATVVKDVGGSGPARGEAQERGGEAGFRRTGLGGQRATPAGRAGSGGGGALLHVAAQAISQCIGNLLVDGLLAVHLLHLHVLAVAVLHGQHRRGLAPAAVVGQAGGHVGKL